IGKFDTLSRELSPGREYVRSEVSEGLMRMLWGYFKKLVVADRLAVPVAALKGSFGPGFLLLTVLYTVRLYADFTGGMDMALGAARALGIRLEENFDRPFSAKSVAEYWRRWHITLGRWMKEYVFYPLCVSRPLLRLGWAARKRLGARGKRVSVYIATGITWLATGLWHGAAPNFLLWGMLNCAFVLISQEFGPLYARFHKRFGWKGKRWYARFEMARTFFLMNLIRACDLFPNPVDYVNRLVSLVQWGTVPDLGLGAGDWWILTLGTALMFGAEGCREKLSRLSPGMKWAGAAVLVLITLVFGCYGLGYDAGSFIYAVF
ncbi:MAG: MBOAT family O-acyltransferase, partial [Candidatus Faecousia sp.]|nr:MBOAT family O-acyltransferase [Candidatus Faecousia sp.]